MIEVVIRDKNRIINVISPGKSLLRGRVSHSPFFHNPLEFLLTSLGVCIGGKLHDYCRFNSIDAAIFESIYIINEENNFLIIIKRPKDFSEDHQSRIERQLTNCTISKELVRPIKVKWELNELSTEDLVKKESKRGCCGGS